MKVLGLLGVFAFALTLNASAQTKADAAQKYNDGVAAFNAKNFQLAIDAFNGAIKIAEQVGEEANDVKDGSIKLLPTSYLQNAMVFYKANNFEASIKEFNKAIEVGKKYNDNTIVTKASGAVPQLYRIMGNRELEAKNFEKAKEYYRMGLNLNPEATNSLLGLGLVYSKQDKVDSALVYFDKVIEIGKRTNKLDEVEKANSQARDMLLEQASEAEKAKKYEDAHSNYESALKYAPQSEVVYYKLAFCNYTLSKWDDAEDAAKKTLEYTLNPNDKAKVYFLLAGVGEAKKDIPMACENYKLAQADPKYKAQATARRTALKCQ